MRVLERESVCKMFFFYVNIFCSYFYYEVNFHIPKLRVRFSLNFD